ncbi:putative sieve element occlusion [Helianthus annuus]|nr:putative sieve element occlusion [Helianthus annuus]KAJ0729375.1 putative sieve element occlusion [Helianthus annuus]KAJ0732107.1 putative sieve element occlusion [Helianthus annuus]
MDQSLSNYTNQTSPSLNPEKRLLTTSNPLTSATNPLTPTTNPFTGAANSAMNQLQQQLPHQQHQRQPLLGRMTSPVAQQQLLGPMTNPVAQQLLGMSPNPMHQQQLMGPKNNQMLNSMMNPMHTPRQHELMGPMHNPMMQQLNRGESNSIFSASDDNVIMKQVLDTHLPDGTEVDVKPLVNIVEEILKHATIKAAIDVDASTSMVAHTDHVGKLEDRSHQTDTVAMLHLLSHTIDKLACEMAFKCLTGGDGHSIALGLFHDVANYHWDAKLALILAAFALNYGEFWLLAQIYSSNQLAKSMAVLRQVPMIMEHSAPLKPKFDALNKLIHSIIELTRCILQFKELPSMYVTTEVPAMARALSKVPTAVYWNVRGIIACAAQITSLTSMGHEYGISSSEMQSWELTSLVHKIDHLIEFLKKQLEECHRLIGERKEMDFRQSFSQMFDTVHIDNMKILKIILNYRDEPLPLFDGVTKQRVNLEVLRKRNVLLLISGLDMSNDELSILEQIYSESRIQGSRMDTLYDLVWVPIVDPDVEYTEAMHRRFEEMRSTMPWYSVNHPSNIDRAVKKSIGDRWHFRNKPILVVLDPQGRELSPNALHMMWIWGSVAFPFTIAREEALWRDETWRLELLVSSMDPTILDWVRDGKYIFLYGGDDIEWIRKFTSSARAMANAAGIQLEMAYVGKSKKKENVRRAIATINVEKLSYCWQDTALIWFFWTRLESMLFSKIQLKRADDQDLIMLQIKKLLSYDKDGSWALLCKGSQILTNGHGSTMLQTPVDFERWKPDIPSIGFDSSFKQYHDKLHVEANNCCRFEFPIAAGRIPEGMRCPECHRLMEKHIAFSCCHDQTGLLEHY